jgi:predicted RNA-binding protein with TRAM domain
VSAVVDTERRLRALAGESPRTKAFRVELNARVRDMLVGPGATQLSAIEEVTKRRFFLESNHEAPLDHFHVLARGPLAKLQPQAAIEEGQELELKLVEVGLYDPDAGVGKLDGLDVAVAGASKLVGKKVRVRVARVMNGTAFATLAGSPEQVVAAITAEGLAEKPTRASRSRKVAEQPEAEIDEETAEEPVDAVAEEVAEEPTAPKKRTRRGSRGGRNRRKKPVVAVAGDDATAADEPVTPKIHLPAADLGAQPAADGANGDEAAVETGAATPKKKTRRGSRGGRRRRKPAAVSAETEPAP